MVTESLGAGVAPVAGIDQLLARAADVTVLVDWSTGTNLQRWYDPSSSRLRLGDEPTARVIHLVHPDDVPDVLDTVAHVARDGESRTTLARLTATSPHGDEAPLLIAVHDVSDMRPETLLVQAWVVDFDRLGLRDVAPNAAMSSLGAAAPVGLQVRSGNGSVSFENERFTALAAPRRAELDEHVTAALESDHEVMVDLEPADGDVSWLRLRVMPTVDDDGVLLLAVASLEDVTGMRVAQEAADAAETFFRAVFDGSPMATAIVDLDGNFVQVNESFGVVCGYAPEELVGRHSSEITDPADVDIERSLRNEIIEGNRLSFQMEQRYLHGSGHEVWVELTAAPVRRGGGTSHLVLHVEDITARKTKSAGNEAYWAVHDHLTGLPNRRALDLYLDASFGPRRREGDHLVVLFLDLDDFKPVNDTHGHQVGDEVLRTVARRLRNACRENEFVARYGGDEFVVISRGLRTAENLQLLIERIQSALKAPINGLVDETIRVGGSIGVAVAVEGDVPADVLQRADAAAYRAKAKNRGR